VKLIKAEYIETMDRQTIRNGAIAVDGGRIVAVGGEEIARQHPHAEVEDLGKCVVLPGLVNAHTHLELSNCSAGERPASFVDWLKGVITRPVDDASIQVATRMGIAQCHKFGVTTVGDISRQCHLTRPILAEANLRTVSFGELQAMARRRGLLEERLERAGDATLANERLTIGLSPHAHYSIEPAGYARALQVCRQRGMPLAMG
jgi:cytosine/adenosine deaminase-related metal-dependent hydrolase